MRNPSSDRIRVALVLVVVTAGCGYPSEETPVGRDPTRTSVSDFDFHPAVARLRAMSADVSLQRNQQDELIVSIDLGLVGDTTLALRLVDSLPWVDRLNLQDADLDAEDIQLLRRMPTLRRLDLSNSTIREDQLAFLESTPQIEFLLLWGTDIGDAGLPHITSLERLKKLDLSATKITNLSATKITNAGMKQLSELTSLLELYVEVPGISDLEIKRLQESLPGTMIVH